VPITFEITGANVRRRFLISLLALFVLEELAIADCLTDTDGELVLVRTPIISIVGVQVVEFRGEFRALMEKMRTRISSKRESLTVERTRGINKQQQALVPHSYRQHFLKHGMTGIHSR
jgi:hypothetical protein